MTNHRVPDADGGHHYEPCDAADYINSLEDRLVALEAENERLSGLHRNVSELAKRWEKGLVGHRDAMRELVATVVAYNLAPLPRRNCRPEPDNDDNTPEAAGTEGP